MLVHIHYLITVVGRPAAQSGRIIGRRRPQHTAGTFILVVDQKHNVKYVDAVIGVNIAGKAPNITAQIIKRKGPSLIDRRLDTGQTTIIFRC